MVRRVALFNVGQRAGRCALIALEIVSISALILLTRCANYGDVFVGNNIYFIDGDCYARMTRARVCFQHPGTILRHHEFENFPEGTSPHTTAPLDYLIAGIAALLHPLTAAPLDLSGAIVSPLLAVFLGVFLCCWSRIMALPFRFALLTLYAISPILAHGTALGRPDHQSLVIALVAVALCSEWTLQTRCSYGWNVVAGISWALAIWTSLYEPAIMLAVVTVSSWVVARLVAISRRVSGDRFAPGQANAIPAASDMPRVTGTIHRDAPATVRTVPAHRIKWTAFSMLVVLAIAIERRIPSMPWRHFAGTLANWSRSIGELAHMSLIDAVWFHWCGWLLLLAPLLLWPSKPRYAPGFLVVALSVTFLFTIWQVRWSYLFVLIFALLLPDILLLLRNRWLAAIVFTIGLFPLAKAWDRTFSPQEISPRAENRLEAQELRAIASRIEGPFLAPWWLSPALAYWSKAAGVAGSSHESISGIGDSARFYAAVDPEEAQTICGERHIQWIVSYDADRVAASSANILGHGVSPDALCYVLDRTPSRAPAFFELIDQTGRFKLLRVTHSP